MSERAREEITLWLTRNKRTQSWLAGEISERLGYKIDATRMSRMLDGTRPASTKEVGVLSDVTGIPLEDLVERGGSGQLLADPPVRAYRRGRFVATLGGERGGYLEDSVGVEYAPVPAHIAGDRELASVDVIGDCMTPHLVPGDVAIVARHHPRNGQIVAARVIGGAEDALLKRYYYDPDNSTITLRPNHGEARTFAPDELDIIGVVIGRYQTVNGS